ncbi:hypothetical protein DUI87_07738 [Hirundo rustica rustica]|uniref:Uncharacterized protein n=1 Tax=Hirundo rustica rustica TaxID=333673 RepID=A0A3M0KR11_HIRRU|nr:hypothetical protein DUI87_07738 [Hirundo rustica rustica]
MLSRCQGDAMRVPGRYQSAFFPPVIPLPPWPTTLGFDDHLVHMVTFAEARTAVNFLRILEVSDQLISRNNLQFGTGVQ